MEGTKPVLAGKKTGRRLKELEARVDALEKTVECDPCTLIAALQKPACKFDFENGIEGWDKTGGCDINVVRAELLVDDQVVMSATGKMHRDNAQGDLGCHCLLWATCTSAIG
ncbi:hypothetical protein ACROYT_G030916 [Oculina patagonica]